MSFDILSPIFEYSPHTCPEKTCFLSVLTAKIIGEKKF